LPEDASLRNLRAFNERNHSMRNILVSVTTGCLMLGAGLAQAQDLKPRPSPAAKVEQQVGTALVTVEYSSPGVKKRKIWGDLVPEGKLWRTGANA